VGEQQTLAGEALSRSESAPHASSTTTEGSDAAAVSDQPTPVTTKSLARATFERFGAIHRFDALDGLRALSVIAVIWHHTSGRPGPAISSRGDFAPDLFFAISGFLICTLLIREHNKHGRIALRKFYIRRTLRIFPLYYATLLLCIGTTLVATSRHNDPVEQRFLQHLPAFATYTSNWVVEQGDKFYLAWTLATEEQFYLLWPPLLIAALAIGKRKIWVPLLVLGALIVISQGSRFVLDTSVLPGRIPSSMSLSILLSCAAALTVSTPRGFALLASVLGRRWSAPAVALTLLAVLAFAPQQQLTQVLIVCLVVSVCLLERTPLHPLLQWRPLVFVGVISYGVYLLHMLGANMISKFLHQSDGLVLFAATIFTSIIAGYLSFRYFETPVLKFKRRFETNSQRQGDELTRITIKSGESRTARVGARVRSLIGVTR
jgi:peptidoglycan/LPS O-acetylase OafA/YrhL